MSKWKCAAVLLVGGLLAGSALATPQTKKFREGGGSGFVNVTFDDTYIIFSPADDTSHGAETSGIIADTGKCALIAVKDLFTQIPASSGGCNIQISNAKLHLFRSTGSSSTTVSINRLTTNWVPGSAGTNENDISGMHSDKSANVHWASGSNFSSSDYDTGVVTTGAWGSSSNQELIYTVTNQVAGIYSAGVNYGLVVRANAAIAGRASEYSTSSRRPQFEVTYDYPPAGYTLTVNSGTGSGTYSQGTVVSISANAAASGKFFDKWTGNTSGIANVNASSTTLTMPAAAQTITATYTWVASGLVSRFTFDIDARDSIGSNNGTLTGGALVANDATRSNVVSLDGTDDYVDLPTSGLAAGRSEMTLSLWINPDEWVFDNTIYDEDDNNWWQYSVREDGWYTRDSSTGTQGSRDNDLSMPSVSTGQWHHLAFVYSVSAAKKAIYLDGLEYASTTTSVDALTSERTAVRIGWPGDGQYYDGLVDDVRLYNRALGLTELALVAEKTVYTLTVNSGTGGGQYASGQVINIVAGAAPSGQAFSKWIGNTSGIANVSAASTTITMPASNATITATYSSTGYVLTVNSGTGSGTYTQGTIVNISANAPASGKQFDKWIGNTSGIANVNASSTTLTMPAAAQTITATYVNIYVLTVNSGTGSGTYTQGTVVNIAANTAPSGKTFDKWTGNTSGIANVNASSTTLTMPAAAQTITATYKDITYTLTVNSGSGDGDYTAGTVVNISADAAPSGKTFDKWTGNTSGIANVNSASTTLTMPAANQTVTATYKDITYTLTVNGGTGGGSYAQGTVVNISANAAASGQFFDKWTGNTANIANINAASTTLTMPAANQTITATYTWVASGLVSRLTFDIDARDSIGGNNGTLTGGALVANDATRGSVLSLDGTDDYVSLPTGGMAAGRSEVTLAMWVNPDAWASGRTLYDEAADAYWQFTLIYGSYCTRDSSTGTQGTRDNDIALPTLTTGQWQHLAVTYTVSGAKKQVYLNGVPGASSTTSIDALTSSRTAVGIGYASDGTTFDGLIDDVRLYSRALNSTEIAYLAGQTLYTLTVNSGTGSGSYVSSQVVNIVANAAPSGKVFDKWTGNTSGIANVNASSTTLTMPAANQTVTATYKDAATYYTLTVNSGTGSGSYTQGTVVGISANAPASGKQFSKWIGNTSGIANVNASSTTLTMPAANQTITATYVDVTTYTLTVNTGTGGGNYAQGTVVSISANAPASGKAFDKWVGNTSGIANVNASSTTLTMPAAAQTITATYVDAGSGPSISGTSGTWSHGNSMAISGANFGTKSTAAPVAWDNLEDGSMANATVGAWSDTTALSINSTDNRHARSSYNASYTFDDRTVDEHAHFAGGSDSPKWFIQYWFKLQSGWVWGTGVYGDPDANLANVKIFRMWSTSDTQENFVVATVGQYDVGARVEYVYEPTWGPPYVDPDPGWVDPGNLGWKNFENDLTPGTWHCFQFEYKDSDQDTYNGVWRFWLDGKYMIGHTALLTRDTAHGTHYKRPAVVGFYDSWRNSGSTTPYTYYIDEAYIDNTWARVEIGNASTYGGCTQREVQIPTAWSSSSITVTLNQGAFSGFSGKYLYVVDANGSVNSNGYAIN